MALQGACLRVDLGDTPESVPAGHVVPPDILQTPIQFVVHCLISRMYLLLVFLKEND